MMIKHDVAKELGSVCTMRMQAGVSYLIDLAVKEPGEIHIFEVADGTEKVTVVMAVSEEAKAELTRRLI